MRAGGGGRSRVRRLTSLFRGEPCLDLPWIRQERHTPAGLLARGVVASKAAFPGMSQWLQLLSKKLRGSCARRLQLQGQPQIEEDPRCVPVTGVPYP